MIYIALDYNGIPINAVFSKSEELAKAFWHGKDIYPHHIEYLDYKNLENHPTGVIPIINTLLKRLDGQEVYVVEKR